MKFIIPLWGNFWCWIICPLVISGIGIPLCCPWNHALPTATCIKILALPSVTPPPVTGANGTFWKCSMRHEHQILATGLSRVRVLLEEPTPKSDSHHSPCLVLISCPGGHQNWNALSPDKLKRKKSHCYWYTYNNLTNTKVLNVISNLDFSHLIRLCDMPKFHLYLTCVSWKLQCRIEIFV